MDRLAHYIQRDHAVLDPASGPRGSFPLPPCRLVLLDQGAAERGLALPFVQADSHYLPFAERSFDAVIEAHCLEHVNHLDPALSELKRVLKSRCALYVSVPDASTFTDQVYRWLYLGGGHVNAFVSQEQLARRIEAQTGLVRCGVRTLYSGLHFLARRRVKQLPRRRRYLFPGLPPPVISLFASALSLLDRLLGTRLTVYGWEMYFTAGGFLSPIDLEEEHQDCSSCGSAYAAGWLRASGAARGLGVAFRCPGCSSWNLSRLPPRAG